MAVQFVQGLQSGNMNFYKVGPGRPLPEAHLLGHVRGACPKCSCSYVHMQVGATCKHFAAYSLEQAAGTTRFRFNAEVSDM